MPRVRTSIITTYEEIIYTMDMCMQGELMKIGQSITYKYELHGIDASLIVSI
jgi:hypothetical protein